MLTSSDGRLRRAVSAPDAARLPRVHRLVLADHLGVTLHPDQLVTLLVDEQFALRALEALAAQAPDAVVAKGAGGALKDR